MVHFFDDTVNRTANPAPALIARCVENKQQLFSFSNDSFLKCFANFRL